MSQGGGEVGEVIFEIKANIDSLNQQMANVNRQLEQHGNKGSSTFGEIMTGALRKVGEAFVDMGRRGVEAMKNVVSEGLAFNAQIESYEQAMTVALRSQTELSKEASAGLSELEKNELKTTMAAQQAGDVIEKVKQDAARTPFSVSGLAEAEMLLISAGVNAEDSRKTILALGDAVAATGGSSDTLSRMSANLQQIKNVGKATSMDIRQFAMAGIDIYGMLADYTGKTTAEVQKMDVSYDVLAAALEKAGAVGGRYYGGMAMQAQTYNGKISTLKDNFAQFAGTATASLTEVLASEGGVLDFATGALQKLTDAISENGLSGAFDAALEILKNDVLPKIGEIGEELWNKGLEWIGSLGEGFTEGAPDMIDGALESVFGLLDGLLEGAYQFLDVGIDFIGNITQGILDAIPGFLENAPTMISDFIGELSAKANDLVQAGWDVIKNVASGLWDNRHEILTAAWDTMTETVNKIFETDWLGTGMQILSDIVSGLWQVAQDLWEDIKSIGSTAAEWISGIDWSKVGEDIITFILNGLKFLFFDIPNKLAEIGSEAIESIKNIDWWGAGKALIDGIVNGIKAAPGAIKDAVMGLADGAWKGVKKFFHISSPSRLMRDTVGKPIAQGMAVGIEDGADDVNRAMDEVASGVYDTALDASVNYNLPDLSNYAQDLGASFDYQTQTEITVPVTLDGREIARGTAYYMNQQMAWEG